MLLGAILPTSDLLTAELEDRFEQDYTLGIWFGKTTAAIAQ